MQATKFECQMMFLFKAFTLILLLKYIKPLTLLGYLNFLSEFKSKCESYFFLFKLKNKHQKAFT